MRNPFKRQSMQPGVITVRHEKPSRKHGSTKTAMWMIFALALASMVPGVNVAVLGVPMGSIAACAGAYNYVEGRRDWTAAANGNSEYYPDPKGFDHD